MNSTAFLDMLYKNLSDRNCPQIDTLDYGNFTATQLRDCLSGTSSANTSEISAFYFYQTEQVAFLWILFIFIVVGNSSVLLALFLAKARRSRMNFFITHLALADLSVGLISVATDIAWRMTVAWHAGNIACKAIRFFQVLVTYSSTYVLIALSIDRCDAITHPMNFSGGWRRAKILVSSSWILSAVFSSPILFLYEQKIIQGQPQCWIDLHEQWQWQLYVSLVCITVFIVPTIVISGCYLIIVYTIWKKSANMDQTRFERKSNPSIGGAQQCAHEELEKRVSSRGVIPRAKMKTVKMTFVIVTVFILCWSPYIIFDLLQVFGHLPNTQTMVAVASFIQSLAPLNSATNPIVYCLFSTRLCRNLRKIPLFDWFAKKTVACIRCQVEPSSSTYQIVKGKPLPYGVSRTTSSDPTQSTSMSNSLSGQPLVKPQLRMNAAQLTANPVIPVTPSPAKEENFEKPKSRRETVTESKLSRSRKSYNGDIVRSESRLSRSSRKSYNGDLNCERQRYARAKVGDELDSSLFDFEGEVVELLGTKCTVLEPNLLNAVAVAAPLSGMELVTG